MPKQNNSKLRLIDLQSMPFNEALSIIVEMKDAEFWAIVRWLAAN